MFVSFFLFSLCFGLKTLLLFMEIFHLSEDLKCDVLECTKNFNRFFACSNEINDVFT